MPRVQRAPAPVGGARRSASADAGSARVLRRATHDREAGQMRAVVLGGTSGMGRAIAQRLAERGDSVFVLGIGESELARSAADLKARHPRGEGAGFAELDLERPEGFASA